MRVSPWSICSEPGMFKHLFSQPWEGEHFHPQFLDVKMEAQRSKTIFIAAKLGFNPDLLNYLQSLSFSPYGLLLEGDKQGI